MFLGRWLHNLSIDSKNRLTLPAPARAASMAADGTSHFMVGVLEDRCLKIHTPEQHEAFFERIKQRLGDTRRSRKLKTYVHSRFVPLTTDAMGRITIPAFLKEAANLEKGVVVIGQETRLEVWAVEELAKLEQEFDDSAELSDALEEVFESEEAELRAPPRTNDAGEGDQLAS